jgi:hypothetical protein
MLLKGAVIGLILAPIPYLYRHGLFSYKSITKGGLYAICFCLPFVGWMISNQNIDRTHLGLDGVNQVQMITKKVIEDPQSEYKTPSEIVNTAKQNIAWHAIYHVPNQIIPSIHLFDLKNSSFGNYIALILCLALFIVLVKQAGTFSPLLLSVVPVIILATVMTIGGAERYWFTITSILLLPVFCYLLKSFQRTTIQLFSLIAFASNHESNPYTVIEDRDDLARLFIQAEKTCTNNQNTSIRNTWTKNEHAFQLVTGCKASMVNSAIGVDPTFTHAVLHLDKLQHSPSNIIKRANHYVWIELPEHMKKSEIIENYY